MPWERKWPRATLDDPESLKAAFAGIDAVLVATKNIYGAEAKAREVRQVKAAADGAVAASAKHIIYSTAVHCEAISNGKYPVPLYGSKAEVEAYIRALPIKSAFFAPGVFMQNLSGGFAARPSEKAQPGVYAIANIVPSSCVQPWMWRLTRASLSAPSYQILTGSAERSCMRRAR